MRDNAGTAQIDVNAASAFTVDPAGWGKGVHVTPSFWVLKLMTTALGGRRTTCSRQPRESVWPSASSASPWR
jgi:hypothetical protein